MLKYGLPFSDLVGEVDMYTTDDVLVYVLNHLLVNSKWFTAAGRFTSEEERLEARDHLVGDINRHSFWLWSFDGISVSSWLAFQDYVDSQRTEANQQRHGTLLVLNGLIGSDSCNKASKAQ